jgi:tetratricopeptide (TPR) repeat protein
LVSSPNVVQPTSVGSSKVIVTIHAPASEFSPALLGAALNEMGAANSQRGELDEALGCGSRALATAWATGDLELRILATGFLEQAHYYRGEYERVLTLTADNLAALPADWVGRNFGGVQSAAVYDRHWLVGSLAELGRFAEAAAYEAEILRLAEQARHVQTIGVGYNTAGMLYLLKGDWVKARSLLEHSVTVVRTGDSRSLAQSNAIAASAWALAELGEASEALNRVREGEQIFDRSPGWRVVGNRVRFTTSSVAPVAGSAGSTRRSAWAGA